MTQWFLADDAEQLEDAIRRHSWVDGLLGGVGASLDLLGTVVDPLGSLAAWGAAWLIEHVRPLREALDRLAGDPSAVASPATAWQHVATVTAEATTGYPDSVRTETQGWRGDSGDAYRRQAEDQASALRAVTAAFRAIRYAVEGAGLLVSLVRGMVRDMIAQFVATLAVRLPQWLAEEGLTFGLGTPVVVGQVAGLVARWAGKIQRFLRALLDSLRRLSTMVERLGRILTGPRTRAPSGWREGEPVPSPRTGKALPSEIRLSPALRGENDPADPHRIFFPDVVHYMSPAEREEHRLFVDADGSLRSARDGRRYDTAAGATAWSGSGRAIFVMDRSGNLYATLDQRVGRVHHSSLVAGGPVAGAGEIEVRDGRLVAMTDRSGHYQPAPEMNDRALQNLRDQGLVPHPQFRQYGWDGEER